LSDVNGEVHGIPGILSAYNRALSKVILSGPTYFSEIVQNALIRCDYPQSQDRQHYHILLILTDGEINDMEPTKQAIIAASELPLSIIIIGVGDANFDMMSELDGDEKKLSSHGQTATVNSAYYRTNRQRDIVQFVPFRKFAGNSQELAKETLAEIPAQFLTHMQAKHVNPNAKIAGDEKSLVDQHH